MGSSSNAWFVNFSNGYVYINDRNDYNLVRLVRASQFSGAESALAFVLGADFAPVALAQGTTLEQSLSPVTLSWLPKSAGNPLPLPLNVPTVDLQKMATNLKVLALADIHRAPALATGSISLPKLTEPVRDAFQPRPVSIPAKGEFETTAAFEARKQQADQEAKKSAEQAYQSALRAFNAEQLAFKQQQAQQEADNAAARARVEARRTDPQA